MGTSNWQNIPFCIDLLRFVNPSTILDIGVGFGRWGIIAREFLEVWQGRIYPNDWQIRIDGIEAFSSSIHEYHKTFYNNIFECDAYDIINEIGTYDIIILGDVLEHFSPERAQHLLHSCKCISKYVLLNIPLGDSWPQERSYENIFEKHLSIWHDQQLTTEDLIKKQIFHDFANRPYGVYLYKCFNNYKPIQKTPLSTPIINNNILSELNEYFSRHPKRAIIFFKLISFFRIINNFLLKK